MDDNNLKYEMELLISSKREDDYWDFKEKHHINTADLLHDIICMANNRADRDSYIIYGVEDKTYKIIGIENDENRRNQQEITNQIKTKKFASGVRPRIELRTIMLEKHQIDILIVKNSTDTPYFLIENHRDGKRSVKAHHIYTRVCDTNTDIDKSADINHIEYLWKKRFLLNRSPLEQIVKRLENKEEWIFEKEGYYNIFNPEYTLKFEDEERDLRPEFYAYNMMNESTFYAYLSINYFGTRLYGVQIVILDGSTAYSTPVPNWEFLSFDKYKMHDVYSFKYFIMQDVDYKLNIFLYDDTNLEKENARNRLFEVVLIFRDSQEKEAFIQHIYENKDKFINRFERCEDNYSWIEEDNKKLSNSIVSKLKTGKILKQMLEEFREIT